MLKAYFFSTAVGSCLIGIGIGLILGVSIPKRMLAWREAAKYAALGLLAIGVALSGYALYGLNSS